MIYPSLRQNRSIQPSIIYLYLWSGGGQRKFYVVVVFFFLTFLLLFHSLCNPLLFGFSTYLHWNLFASVTSDFPLVKSNVYFLVLINCTSGSVLINYLFLLKTFSSFEMCHFFFSPSSWARSQYISLNYIENHCPHPQ